MTTASRATRASSARPRDRSRQWCTVSTAMAASNAPSRKGRRSAVAWTTGARPAGRWWIIVHAGSTATTRRSAGSYDPVPAPTFTTDVAEPRAESMAAAIRGSGRRWAPYVPPISSYSWHMLEVPPRCRRVRPVPVGVQPRTGADPWGARHGIHHRIAHDRLEASGDRATPPASLDPPPGGGRMTCRDAIAVLSDYLDRILAGEAAHRLDRHIADCEECRAHVNAYQRARRVVAGAGRVEMPDAMTARRRDFLLAELGGRRADGGPDP